MLKNPPANAGEVRDQAQSLGREDPLEEGIATRSVFSPGASPGRRSLAGHSPWAAETRTRLSESAQRAVPRAGCGRAPWVSQPSATHGRLPAPASPGEDSASPEMIPGRFLLLGQPQC